MTLTPDCDGPAWILEVEGETAQRMSSDLKDTSRGSSERGIVSKVIHGDRPAADVLVLRQDIARDRHWVEVEGTYRCGSRVTGDLPVKTP